MMARYWSLLVGLVVWGSAVATAQEVKSLPIAFVGVVNESGYGGAVFKEQVGDALLTALHSHPLLAVRDARDRLALPASLDAFCQVGKEMQVPAVLQVVVQRVNLRELKGARQTAISLEAQLVPTKMPALVLKAQAEGKGEDAAEGRAIAKAVSAAATAVVQQLSALLSLRGQVLLPPAYAILPATYYKERDRLYQRTVRISLDMVSGLPVGAEVVILKHGQPVARGRVVEVDYGSSLVALTEVLPNVRLQSGDEVRVTLLPPRPERLPLPLAKEKEYKRVEHDFALALFLAGAGVAFLGE